MLKGSQDERHTALPSGSRSSPWKCLAPCVGCGAVGKPGGSGVRSRMVTMLEYTCAVCPTYRYGAFLFVVFALADLSSARLTTCDRNTTRKQALDNGSAAYCRSCI